MPIRRDVLSRVSRDDSPSESGNVGDLGTLADFADEISLDRAAALDALQDGRFDAAVGGDIAQARGLGIRGVPFFVLNGTPGLDRD